MLNKTYPFELPPLPYDYSALEPYIDAETLHYHHDKHFRTYIDKLNAALKPHPHLHDVPLSMLLTDKGDLPPEAATEIIRNGGGTLNHYLYFDGLAPPGDFNNKPGDKFGAVITRKHGSFDKFKEAFNKKAASVYGSGWTALVQTPGGGLNIVNIANQETTLPLIPLILVDVWEHAYYLKYKNMREEYLKNIWNVLKLPI